MFITIVALILGLAMFALMIYCEFFIIKEIIKFIKGAFKKKTTTTNGDATYVNVNNTHTIKRSDNKPISDDEIPDLIKLGYQHALERERQSKNGKFHRTGKEEDASFQFAINHKDQIKEHVSPFQTCFGLARNENDLDKKIELLQRTIMLFEQAKTWFYQSKGGTIYFQDMYENLHNSRNECFSYIDTVKEQLEYCIRKRDYLIPVTLGVISSNSNGILQKDIYEHIPDATKREIQQTISELENEGLITREKSGNTYLLSI